MYVSPRKDRKFGGYGMQAGTAEGAEANSPKDVKKGENGSEQGGPRLEVFYGSNAGTCKALAKKLVDSATRRGMSVTLRRLNDISSGDLPKDAPMAIVTASYEGQVRQSSHMSPALPLTAAYGRCQLLLPMAYYRARRVGGGCTLWCLWLWTSGLAADFPCGTHSNR
jgi:hypothetical protein